MPTKTRPISSAIRQPDPMAAIPTTIKNPARVAQRRKELIEVSTKLFLERGFHNTSVRDIVRACTFNIASLYMYVSSKEDILYLVAQDLMDTIARELDETVLADSADQSLEIGFRSYCRIVDRFRRHIRLLYREVGFLPQEPRSNVLQTVSGVVTYFEKIIAEGVRAGVFREVPARLVALDMMIIAHAIALHTRDYRAITDLDSYIDFQLDTILLGLLRNTQRPGRPRSVTKAKKPAAARAKRGTSRAKTAR